MSVEDNFPDAELGQCLNEEDAVIMSCLIGTGGVTKGKFVALADGVTIPPTVVACGAAKPFGVALKTGDEGDTIPIAIDNAIIKMEVGATAALTAGLPIKSDTDGNIILAVATDYPLTAGILLQTMALDGDQGLVFIKCNTQVAAT